MAESQEDRELELARKRARSFEEKAQKLRQGGGRLNSDGKFPKEPALTAPRGGKGPKLKERSVKAKPVGWTPNNNPKNDDKITGKSIRLDNVDRYTENFDDVTVGIEQPKQALLRPSNFSIPTVRSKRIANSDGATSFHFSHEAISKTKYAKETARGTKNRKGAAKDHARYIERDGAVAEAQADDLDKIEKELADIAKTDPELARKLGLEIEGEESSREQDDKSVAEKIAGAMNVGALAGIYIEREEALAHDDNGTAVLFTNISADPKERRDFWGEVEKREANPSDDKLHLILKGNEDFWSRLIEDKDCPKKLREAVEAAKPDEEVVVRTGDNESIRKLMRKHGWRPREKRLQDETDEQRAAREEREAQTSFGARFEDGRGGRVQFRIVGELPYDVDHAARIRILKGFANEFEKRNLPYIAVMHSPDHTNDDRNWHFHLVYHDRPVKRFTGREEDHLWELPEMPSKQVVDRHEVTKKALAANLEEHIGKWDFAVPFTYQQKSCRNYKTAYPFAQQKDREVTRRPFIPSLRKKLAELTNRELEAASKTRRLDPRKYSEMGIHKAPDVHLGTQAARLESVGVPTEAGVINEENQWNYIQQALKEEAIKSEREIDRKLSTWEKTIAISDLTEKDKEKLAREMIRWEQESRKAAEHAAISRQLEEHYERLQSRAKKTEKMAKKHLDAIQHERATRRQTNDRPLYQQKYDEARAHLAGLKIMLVDELLQIEASKKAASRHGEAASAHQATIENMLAEGRAVRKAQEAPERNNAKEAQRKNEPVQSNNERKSGLTRSQVENYLSNVLKRNVRIVEEDGVLVPKIKTRRDLEIIASEGYEKTQERLARLKANHDQLIENLSKEMQRNPRMLVERPDVQANAAQAVAAGADPYAGNPSDRYRLATADKKLQQAWRMFAAEPEIIAAVVAAVTVVAEQGKQVKAKAQDLDIDVKGSNAGKENAGRIPAGQSRETQIPRYRETERVLDLTREKFLRPKIERKEGSLLVSFSAQDAALYRLPENLEVSDDRSIKRMEGIVRKNDRSVNRLVKYLEKNPSVALPNVNAGESPISAKAPRELVDLARDHSRDPELKIALQNALVAARLEAADPRRKSSQQENRVDSTVADKKTDRNASAAEHIKAPQKVDELASSEGKTASDASRSSTAQTNSKNSIPADLFGYAEQNSSESSKPKGTKTASENENSRDVSMNKQTAKQDDDVSVKGQQERGREDQGNRPSAPSPVEETTQAKASENPPATAETAPRKSIRERMQERFNLPEPEISLGPKKLGAKDAADIVPERPIENTKERPRRTIIPDSMLGDQEQTRSRKETIKLERGINPKLDAWIDAEERHDRKERERTAAIIRSDRRLLSVVEQLDPVTRAKLQRDWDGVDDRNRQQRLENPERFRDKK